MYLLSHSLGIWLIFLILHGFLVQTFGESMVHLPMLIGLVLTGQIIVLGLWRGIQLEVLLIFLLLLVIMVVAGISGVNKTNALSNLALYGKGYVLAIVLAGCIKEKREVEVISLYFIFGSIVGAILMIVDFFTIRAIEDVSDITQIRVAGLRGDPNESGAILVACIPLLFYWTGKNHRISGRIGGRIMLGIIFTGVIVTSSRGAFIALIIVLLSLFVIRPSLKAFTFVVALVVAITFFAPTDYIDRIETLRTVSSTYDASLSERTRLLKQGLALIGEKPLIGVGPGNFIEGSGKYVENAHKSQVAHNMYVEFAAENGIFGGFLFIFLLAYAVSKSILNNTGESQTMDNTIGLGHAVGISLLGILAASLFLSWGKNSILWFLVGMSLGVGQLYSSNTSTS